MCYNYQIYFNNFTKRRSSGCPMMGYPRRTLQGKWGGNSSVVLNLVLRTLGTPFVGLSQVQTVSDNSGQHYFLRAVTTLCGPRVHVRLGPTSALVYVSGEYLENRNLDSIARDLAQAGLDAFSENNSFYVKAQDSKGLGEASVQRRRSPPTPVTIRSRPLRQRIQQTATTTRLGGSTSGSRRLLPPYENAVLHRTVFPVK
jgi:hypothetical protein